MSLLWSLGKEPFICPELDDILLKSSNATTYRIPNKPGLIIRKSNSFAGSLFQICFQQDIMTELMTYAILKGSDITPPLHAIWYEPSSFPPQLYFMMEKGIDLFQCKHILQDMIQKDPSVMRELEESISWCIHQIHKYGIAHLDIKHNNIVLKVAKWCPDPENKEGNPEKWIPILERPIKAWLIDFGLSHISTTDLFNFPTYTRCHPLVCTTHFRPPESCVSLIHLGCDQDILIGRNKQDEETRTAWTNLQRFCMRWMIPKNMLAPSLSSKYLVQATATDIWAKGITLLYLYIVLFGDSRLKQKEKETCETSRQNKYVDILYSDVMDEIRKQYRKGSRRLVSCLKSEQVLEHFNELWRLTPTELYNQRERVPPLPQRIIKSIRELVHKSEIPCIQQTLEKTVSNLALRPEDRVNYTRLPPNPPRLFQDLIKNYFIVLCGKEDFFNKRYISLPIPVNRWSTKSSSKLILHPYNLPKVSILTFLLFHRITRNKQENKEYSQLAGLLYRMVYTGLGMNRENKNSFVSSRDMFNVINLIEKDGLEKDEYFFNSVLMIMEEGGYWTSFLREFQSLIRWWGKSAQKGLQFLMLILHEKNIDPLYIQPLALACAAMYCGQDRDDVLNKIYEFSGTTRTYSLNTVFLLLVEICSLKFLDPTLSEKAKHVLPVATDCTLS